MPFRITNRAKQLLVVPLNGGDALHLAPGESSAPVEDYELQNNARVEKLLRSNFVELTEEGSPGREAPQPRPRGKRG
jgi:hypothetical protein